MLAIRFLLTIVIFAAVGSSVARAADTSDELVEMVANLISEQDKDLRAVGLEQIRTQVKGEADTKKFAARLPKISPDAQASLLRALADRGDGAARSAVLELLWATRDEPVKVAAIEALGALGQPDDLKLLVTLLAGGSKSEQAAARASLTKLRGEKVPAGLAAQLKAGPAATRIALIDILTTRRALDTVPEILSAALDDDAKVRGAAMNALAQLATREQFPGMLAGVLKSAKGAERDAAERAVAQAAGRITPEDERANAVLASMSPLKADEQAALLPTVGRIGGPAALTAIEKAIADPARHEIGLKALCNWPTASIAPRLIELSKSDEHAEHRALVLNALIRVAPLPDKRPDAERLALVKQVLSMCTTPEQRNLVIRRTRAIRTLEALRFVLPFLDQPAYAQEACETVVELAHHRELREPNKPEFDRALDKVIATTKDPVVIDRANRYKKGQTWTRPKAEPAA